MNHYEPEASEPARLLHRATDENFVSISPRRRTPLFIKIVAVLIPLFLVLSIIAFFAARHWTRQAMRDSLPQIDGTFSIAGLAAPVTVQRDTQGVPHIRAASLDDLIIAQGYVTAQDRLWQMDSLRRYVTGDMAEIFGASMIPHDRLQRTLQIRAAADRALALFPPEQIRWLELYDRGVNASIEAQRQHLPIEFRLLRYQPAPWTPRDTITVGIVLFQDLTTSFPQKLNREALTAKLPPELLADLYPIGSWRDHPPAQPVIDLTAPQENIPDIPLDESQTKLTKPNTHNNPTETASTQDLLTLEQILKAPTCDSCRAGSNNWTVSGAHTATGKPLLSNDMHLTHSVPGIWYEADLEAPAPNGANFHVTGVSLPGVPFIVVGHNDHLAWGFTNLGADVQDVYIEHLRGTGESAEFESPDGTWHPVLHQTETIHVRGGKDIMLDVASTQHGKITTPIISGIFPTEKRTLSLGWTVYDPANISASLLYIDAAVDWTSFTSAFSTFGGPAQNVVYADDQGHIGYHAVGKIPLRGSLIQPTPISPVPVDALDATQEWTSYIPFDQLPQSFDPPNGILATANARVTPDDYAFPITPNWGAPYRNERIWKFLASHDHLTPADMLALQTDVYSDLDHVLAQRFAYAIDHSATKDKRLHQAADILRNWNGNVDVEASAPAIVDAARDALWPLLLNPHLGPTPGASAQLYTWGEKAYAEEQLIMHTPARWLPKNYANWDDLLTDAVNQGLIEARAPFDLNKWQYGKAHPIDIEHPLFVASPILQRIIDLPIGTGIQPQSGDGTTVKQVGRTFGPSERFTADLTDLDHSTLNVVLGQSANLTSLWFLNQWPAWYKGATYPLPFTKPAVDAATTHTLTLTPH
ncbi:MAG TPA: penicillin acylase family protein [Edaphobacter sp.]